MRRYGLVGKDIGYSFSKGYFTEKFATLGIEDAIYTNYDLEDIAQISTLFKEVDTLCGLNVTIPYKENVIPYLTELDPIAQEIGAVNTIAFSGKEIIGFNTDTLGFRASLQPHLTQAMNKAMVLGTGGASKAVLHVLRELDIEATKVSRDPRKGDITYADLNAGMVADHKLIINCTPLGTFPKISKKPELPYEGVHDAHLLYDLVYNPLKSAFLLEGESRGAAICNGIRMLELQAEASWNIWQSTSGAGAAG